MSHKEVIQITTEYNPSPIRTVKIPKSTKGEYRRIFIPNLEDRRYQKKFILPVLNDAIEPLLSNCCYAYRKGIGIDKCIIDLKVLLEDGYKWIVKMDIKDFFDNIHLDRLIEELTPIIPSNTLDDVIASVNVPYLYNGRLITKSLGLYQGLPISPCLANFSLREFDLQFINTRERLIRYSDDILLISKSRKRASKATSLAKKKLFKIGFRVKSTKPVDMTRELIEFLGCSISMIKGKFAISPKETKVEDIVDALYKDDEELIIYKIRGWINFYTLNLKCIDPYNLIKTLVVEIKGIEYWHALIDGGLIPCPIQLNTQHI